MNDDCSYTPEQVVEMLNNGDAWTSIFEDSGIFTIINGEIINLGTVIYNDEINGLGYSDFELVES